MEAAAHGRCSQWGFPIRPTHRCCETLAPEGNRCQVGCLCRREKFGLTVVSRNVEAALGGKVSPPTYRVG
jgi:hypothetical protein